MLSADGWWVKPGDNILYMSMDSRPAIKIRQRGRHHIHS
jgi:hypothetical protein